VFAFTRGGVAVVDGVDGGVSITQIQHSNSASTGVHTMTADNQDLHFRVQAPIARGNLIFKR